VNPTDVRPFVATGNTITVAATGSSAATAGEMPRASNPEMPMTCRGQWRTGVAFIKFGISTDRGGDRRHLAAGARATPRYSAGHRHIISIVAAAGQRRLRDARPEH
jgi:hypothetical protein